MNKTITILILALFLCFELYSQTPIKCTPGAYDIGNIFHYPPNNDYDLNYGDIGVGVTSTFLGHYRGWAYFNIAYIPDGANITSLELYYYVEDNSRSSNHKMRIVKFNAVVSSLNVQGMYSNIGEGSNALISSYTTNGQNSGLQHETLNSATLSRLQYNLEQNYSDIGFGFYEDGDNNNRCIIDASTTNQPYLLVNYTCGKAPSGFSVTNLNSTSTKIKWNSVAGNNGYEIWYTKSSSSSWLYQKTTSINEITLSNLNCGEKYAYKVRTICGDNYYSEWDGAGVEFTAGECTPPPDQPKNGDPQGIYPRYKKENNATFRWDGSSSEYKFYLKLGSTWISNSNGNSVNDEKITFYNLAYGTYYWRVEAIGDDTQIAESNVWEFKFEHSNARPDVPKNLKPVNNTTIFGTSSTRVNFSWECSDDNLSDGDELTFLVVSGNSSSSVNNAEPSSTKDFTYSINDISPGVYYWKVVAEDKDGLKSESTPIKINVVDNTSRLILTKSSLPLGSSSGSFGTFDVESNISWSISGKPSWLSLSHPSGNGDQRVTVSTNSETPSTSDRWADLVVSGSGISWTIQITQAGKQNTNKPPNPPNLSSPDPNATITLPYTLTWTCTDDDDASSSLTYKVYGGTSKTNMAEWGSPSVNSLPVPSLSAGTYYWKVAAFDGKDWSLDSDVHSFTITSSPTNHAPNQPTLLTPSDNERILSSFSFSWECTDDDGDDLTYRLFIGMSSGEYESEDFDEPNYFIDLSNETIEEDITFYWAVQAYDGKTWSPISEERTVIIAKNTNEPTLYVSESSIPLGSPKNSSNTFTITSNTDWTISSDQSWITISRLSGSNNATISVSADSENTSASSRSGTITISGTGISDISIPVTQAGKSVAKSLTVSKSSIPLGSAKNSSNTFTISSNTSWSVVSNQSWITFSPPNGSNNGTVSVFAGSENTSTSSRSGSITVSGSGVTSKTVSVTQSGYTAVNTPPNQPIITSPANGSTISAPFTLSWTCTDDENDDMSFRIYRGTSANNLTEWDNSMSMSYTVSSLSEGTYYWAVRAFDGKDWSPYSETGNFTVGTVIENHPPDKPVLTSPANNESVSTPLTLSWTCNDDDGDNLSYNIYRGTDPSRFSLWASSDSNTYSVSTLPLGAYYWYVKAYDGEKWSVYSSTNKFTVSYNNSPPEKPIITYPSPGQILSVPFLVRWTCSDSDSEDVLNYAVSISRTQSDLAGATKHETTENVKSLYFNDPNFDYKGDWFCQVTASDGKQSTASDILKIKLDWPVFATDIKLLEQIDIFPNPTNDIINVKFNFYTEDLKIRIISASGVLIKNMVLAVQLKNSTLKIDFSDYSQGIYFLQIISGEKSTTRKIIKN